MSSCQSPCDISVSRQPNGKQQMHQAVTLVFVLLLLESEPHGMLFLVLFCVTRRALCSSFLSLPLHSLEETLRPPPPVLSAHLLRSCHLKLILCGFYKLIFLTSIWTSCCCTFATYTMSPSCRVILVFPFLIFLLADSPFDFLNLFCRLPRILSRTAWRHSLDCSWITFCFSLIAAIGSFLPVIFPAKSRCLLPMRVAQKPQSRH